MHWPTLNTVLALWGLGLESLGATHTPLFTKCLSNSCKSLHWSFITQYVNVFFLCCLTINPIFYISFPPKSLTYLFLFVQLHICLSCSASSFTEVSESKSVSAGTLCSLSHPASDPPTQFYLGGKREESPHKLLFHSIYITQLNMQLPPHRFWSFNPTLAFVVYLRHWNEGRCFTFVHNLRDILGDRLPEQWSGNTIHSYLSGSPWQILDCRQVG